MNITLKNGPGIPKKAGRTILSPGEPGWSTDLEQLYVGTADPQIPAMVGKPETYVNVKHFGAKGDGTTDDTAAIKTAHTLALRNGSVLYFPKGTYKFGVVHTPATPLTHMEWMGDGAGLTILIPTVTKPVETTSKKSARVSLRKLTYKKLGSSLPHAVTVPNPLDAGETSFASASESSFNGAFFSEHFDLTVYDLCATDMAAPSLGAWGGSSRAIFNSCTFNLSGRQFLSTVNATYNFCAFKILASYADTAWALGPQENYETVLNACVWDVYAEPHALILANGDVRMTDNRVYIHGAFKPLMVVTATIAVPVTLTVRLCVYVMTMGGKKPTIFIDTSHYLPTGTDIGIIDIVTPYPHASAKMRTSGRNYVESLLCKEGLYINGVKK